jgi:hypothetical protein
MERAIATNAAGENAVRANGSPLLGDGLCEHGVFPVDGRRERSERLLAHLRAKPPQRWATLMSEANVAHRLAAQRIGFANSQRMSQPPLSTINFFSRRLAKTKLVSKTIERVLLIVTS